MLTFDEIPVVVAKGTIMIRIKIGQEAPDRGPGYDQLTILWLGIGQSPMVSMENFGRSCSGGTQFTL